MSDIIDETRLAKLAAGDCDAGSVEAVWMAREILRRRAEDLGDTDKEVLRELMDAIAPGLRHKEEIWRSYAPSDVGREVWRKAKRLTDALAVIESLIGDSP